ncbi:hypothetical protein I656_03149 [Geobacillus sp. WSUCF1]|nr:hypothetical protein I656_03149 [Geobacillus sp. WSUCF1]
MTSGRRRKPPRSSRVQKSLLQREKRKMANRARLFANSPAARTMRSRKAISNRSWCLFAYVYNLGEETRASKIRCSLAGSENELETSKLIGDNTRIKVKKPP